jgi:hypothetical protein
LLEDELDRLKHDNSDMKRKISKLDKLVYGGSHATSKKKGR